MSYDGVNQDEAHLICRSIFYVVSQMNHRITEATLTARKVMVTYVITRYIIIPIMACINRNVTFLYTV